MSLLTSFARKNSQRDQNRSRREFVPSIGNPLEDRKLLSTMVAKAGDYQVTVSDATNPNYIFDSNIYATLSYRGRVIKSNIPVAVDDSKYEEAPSVSINASGKFAVAFQSRDAIDSPQNDIHMRVFNSNGSLIYADNHVADAALNEVAPRVAMNSSGMTVVSYNENDSNNSNVKAVQYVPINAIIPYTRTKINVATSAFSEINESVAVADSGKWAVTYST